MCHSPKNLLGAEKGGDAAFTGGLAEGWWAPSLTQAARDGIGDWSSEDLVTFLKTGRNDRTVAFGPMADVIQHSTRHLSDADLQAIAAYILSFPAQEEDEPEPVADDDPAMQRGRLIYETQCSACHAPEGEGVLRQFPKLAGSSLVQAANTTTLVRLILEGEQAATTPGTPTANGMPAFDWKLTDRDVAAVATYVRNSFGNRAAAVSAEFVEGLRDRSTSGSQETAAQ
jgi:mono/diheme cytochrome c family protein